MVRARAVVICRQVAAAVDRPTQMEKVGRTATVLMKASHGATQAPALAKMAKNLPNSATRHGALRLVQVHSSAFWCASHCVILHCPSICCASTSMSLGRRRMFGGVVPVRVCFLPGPRR